MGERLERGLRLIEQLEASGELSSYHLLPAAKADILRRLGRRTEAAAAYERALGLVTHDAERRYLHRRLRELGAGPWEEPPDGGWPLPHVRCIEWPYCSG